MEKLFEGIFSGGLGGTPGDHIRTPGGLCAGFLIEPGSCGESRSYALFEVDKESDTATFSRLCNKPEKKQLGKAHYHYKALKNVETKTTDNGTCILFVMR